MITSTDVSLFLPKPSSLESQSISELFTFTSSLRSPIGETSPTLSFNSASTTEGGCLAPTSSHVLALSQGEAQYGWPLLLSVIHGDYWWCHFDHGYEIILTTITVFVP